MPSALRAMVAALPFMAAVCTGPAHSESEPPPTGEIVTIVLTDGSRMVGRLVERTDDSLVLESEALGRITVPRARIASIETPEDAPGQREPARDPATPRGRFRLDPDRNSILLGPTPETLPAGTNYFRNFELFVLNLGLSPSDDVNVSIGTLFPISGSLLSISAGLKARLLSREEHGIGLAVAVNGTAFENEQFGALIGIVGIGDAHRSLNLSIHRTFSQGSDATFFVVGGDLQTGRTFKLLAEYANSTDVFLEDEDFNGFVNVGFRVFGDDSSFSLTGFRPLERTGDFLAFPVAMYSRHF